MKRFFSSIVLLFSLIIIAQNASASHAVGADISYTYLGPNQYQVTVKFYRDCTGIPAPVSIFLNWNSASCGLTGNATVNQTGGSGQEIQTGIYPPCGVTSCNTDPATGLPGTGYGVQEYTYQTVVNLPQACADWEFSFDECCRNNAITTLTNPGGEDLYVNAFLDNLNSPINSSPIFSNFPVSTFCINRSFTYNQGAVDPDGDSLVFSLVDCLGAGGVPVAYNVPFSGASPFSSVPPVSIDPATGIISFTPQAVEIGVMTVLVQEYRNGVLIGTTRRDMQVNLEAICNDPPNLDSTTTNFYIGQVNCLDTVLKIATTFEFLCNTLALDGSDFRLISPSGTPIPFTAASIGACNSAGLTDTILLYLYLPLNENGYYTLFSKVGFDGNTILNSCGLALPEFDSVSFLFNNCYPNRPDLRTVTVTPDNENMEIRWSIPDSLPPGQFLRYDVYRSDNGPAGNYSFLVGSTLASNDTAITDVNVDTELQPYNYHVKCVLNTGFVTPASDSIQSIYLTCAPNADSTTINLTWTPYWGFSNPAYTVYQADTTLNFAAVAGSQTSGTSYLYTKPEEGGRYYVRVETNNHGLSTLLSRSNWCEIEVLKDKVFIYNVFTPNNGDNLNQFFVVENIEQYPNSELIVFNRWGKKVYETSNYQNNWDGDGIADGTYYYVLKLNNNKSDEYNGTLTVINTK